VSARPTVSAWFAEPVLEDETAPRRRSRSGGAGPHSVKHAAGAGVPLPGTLSAYGNGMYPERKEIPEHLPTTSTTPAVAIAVATP